MPTHQSFWQLLGDPEGALKVAVPLLQRDYAQGRREPAVVEVRRNFVAALRQALGSPTAPLNLDFVYGTVADGLFTPLDGQQRLTTLFLLHWYLATSAAGAGQVPAAARTTLGRFSYEVRAAARDFCAALAACSRRPTGSGPLSQALAEKAWFRAGWHRDPTVSGMLVMLDELDAQFRDLPDPAAAWAALTGPAAGSPLTFQLLNLRVHQLSDELYTRMNARGKPLTSFENWKAWFHEFLEQQHGPGTAAAFVERLDGDWTDFFWRNRLPGRDSDPAQAVDGPLRAYLNFVTRMLSNTTSYAAVVAAERYQEVYAERDNLDFLMQSLNALADVGENMPAFFDRLLSATNVGKGRVRAFADWGEGPKAADCNLFRACCQLTTEPKLMTEVLFFTVLTYAVRRGALPEKSDLTDLQDLLRILRNRLLQERWIDLFTVRSSAGRNKLPHYLQTLDWLLPTTEPLQNPYERLRTLPTGTDTHRLDTEHYKASQLLRQPETQRPAWKRALHQLEDNDALRGVLHNFDLKVSATALRRTAAAVTEIWPDEVANDPDALVIRAGLTVADYSIQVYDGRWFFGGHDYRGQNGWCVMLSAYGESGQRIRAWLPRFIAAYQQASGTRKERLQALITAAEAHPDPAWPVWQRHFIRYPEMVLCPDWKGGRRGYFVRHSGWNMQQLPKTRVSGYHHNPYVRAIVLTLNDKQLCREENCSSWGWNGNGPLRYEKLAGTEGISLHMTEQGWLLELPESLLPLTGIWAELPARLGKKFALVPALNSAPRQWFISQLGQWDLVQTGVAVSQALAQVLGGTA